MFPTLSIAIEPIQRLLESTAYVPCWKRLGVLFVTRSSYQRTPDSGPVPGLTEWFKTIASWPSAKRRYASRYIKRSASESSFCVVPDCGMHVPPLHASLKAATASVLGPVIVELAGVVQSVCIFQTRSEFEPKLTKYSGAPAGGAVCPSMSAGSTPPKAELNWKHCSVAAAQIGRASCRERV